jgi:hypothetical protein
MKAGNIINIEFYKCSFRMPNFPIHPKTILEKIKKKDEEEKENFWKFANFKSTEVHLALASSYHFHMETHASCHFIPTSIWKPIQVAIFFHQLPYENPSKLCCYILRLKV